jgi:succinate dehydrogenase / fumarate reductase flavoprotein subunit
MYQSLSWGTVDQPISMVIAQAMTEIKPTMFGERLGAFHERRTDGSYGATWPTLTIEEKNNRYGAGSNGFFPRFLCQKVKKSGARVFDQTIFLDVLIGEDGAAAGGIALDLRTGEVSVHRAKSVVMAMGHYNWMMGWSGMRAHTICGPESTGDPDAILLRHGLGVHNLEFLASDNSPWYPACQRDTMGMSLEPPNWELAVNSEGEYFLKDYIQAHPEKFGVMVIPMLVTGEYFHGRGSEHCGVWVEAGPDIIDQYVRFYRRYRDHMKRVFGYDPSNVLEVAPEFWSSYGTPKLDTRMQTQISGLFRAAGVHLSAGIHDCLAVGHIAGISAAEDAAGKDYVRIDWQQVNDIVTHTYELLEREPSDGIRAREVMRKIQLATGEGLDTIRDEAGMTATLEELRRIRREDIPRMCVLEHTRQYNTEWKNAIEVEFAIDTITAVATAALERKETRFFPPRSDYQDYNNDEYMGRIVVTKNGDEFTTEFEEADFSYLDKETVSQICADVTLNSYEKFRNGEG